MIFCATARFKDHISSDGEIDFDMVQHARITTLGQNGITCEISQNLSTPDFYWERQSGGLCRMHALNAYFGGPKYDRSQFEDAIHEHDLRMSARGLENVSANDVDVTSGDQKNIIAHVLAKSGIFAKLYEIRDRPTAIAKAESYGAVFIYSPDHVWLGRRDTSGRWFRIDSLSGVSLMNLNDLQDPRLGLIIPCNRLMNEFAEIAAELGGLIQSDNKSSDGENRGEKIVAYLVREYKARRLLGRAETLIGAAVAILEIQLAGRDGFPVMRELLDWYEEFAASWTGANCTSLRFILTHVPRMIIRILQIGHFN